MNYGVETIKTTD